jgi:glutaredoxin
VALIVVLGLYYVVQNKNNPDLTASNNQSDNSTETTEGENLKKDTYYLFVSNTCPHCKKVEEFIEENKIEETTEIIKYEMSDPNNQKYFLEAGELCNQQLTGVPVLYKNNKCLVGDQPIIDELSKE